MGGFCPLEELHPEGSAPAACAAGLFFCSFGRGLVVGGGGFLGRWEGGYVCEGGGGGGWGGVNVLSRCSTQVFFHSYVGSGIFLCACWTESKIGACWTESKISKSNCSLVDLLLVPEALVSAVSKAKSVNEGESRSLLYPIASGSSGTSFVARLADVCKMSACNMNIQASTPTPNRAKAPA